VSLTVSDAGGSDMEVKADYITVTVPPPVADFEGIPTSGPVPLAVVFTDLSTGNPTSWLWTFGDGETSAEQEPTHAYTAPGGYTVSLRVENASGWDTEEKANYIVVTFTDVASGYCPYLEILACATAGIVTGLEDGSYHPEWIVTRDQMAVYISRGLAGGEEHVPMGPAEATFPDVPTDHWAYNHVEYALANSVVAGYRDDYYHPEVVVDRGQMAVFIARAMVAPAGDSGVPPGPEQPTFWDVTRDNEWSWCYNHVEYIVSEGVAQGYEDGGYHPEYACTRDQMAVYVARAFDLTL